MSYDNIGKYRQVQAQRQQAKAEPLDEIGQLEQLRKSLPPSWVPGWAEVPATLASGMGSSILGGLSALGTVPLNALGLSDADPRKVLESFQQDYTYMPRTMEGMGATYAMGKAFEKLHAPVAWAANKTLEATGSPALATAVDVGPTALGALAGVPMGGAKSAYGAARALVPDVAPSRPGLGPGIKGQRGVISRAELFLDPANIRRATTMAAAGRNAYDIIRKTGAWVPTRDGPMPPGGVALAERPDKVSEMTPKNLNAAPDEKRTSELLTQIATLDTLERVADMSKAGLSFPEIKAQLQGHPGIRSITPEHIKPQALGGAAFRRKLIENDLETLYKPRYAGKVGDAFDNPGLLNMFPSLKEINFRVDPWSKYAGSYYPEQNLLEVSGAEKHQAAVPTIVAHELNHAVHRQTGLPPGMAPSRAKTDLTESYRRGLVSENLFRFLMNKTSDDVYHRAWGEGLANASMHALGKDEKWIRDVPPWARMTDRGGNPIDPSEFWIPYK